MTQSGFQAAFWTIPGSKLSLSFNKTDYSRGWTNFQFFSGSFCSPRKNLLNSYPGDGVGQQSEAGFTHSRDSLACHEGLGRRTFALEVKEECHDSEQQLLVGRPTVHVFKSKLTSADSWSKSGSELWDAHARELIESDLYSDDVKFLAVMSATRYAGAAASDERPPRSHSELLSRVKGHAALGGGGLALFGSGCLYTWPERLDQVQLRLRDRTEVDWRRFMDDSAFRYVGDW